MMQTRRQTINEVVLSTAFAFILSAVLQHWVVNPIWHLESSWMDSLGITVFFTVVSLVRSYYMRRFFNWWHHHVSAMRYQRWLRNVFFFWSK